MYLPTVSESPSEKHEEKFHDYLTLLTSTEKQLTQAKFKLVPSGTWSVAMPTMSCRWEQCTQSFDPMKLLPPLM